MTTASLCPISGESPNEERLNYLTHLAGLIVSIMGWAFLLFSAQRSGDISHMISCSIYGATLVLLYGASTYYHGCQKHSYKRVWQVIDHACIYLLIAGTYTPFSLIALSNESGWNLLYVEWAIAILGIVTKIFIQNRFRVLSVITYMIMGWLVLFNLPSLMETLPWSAILWLMGGGVVYTLGVLFYMWETLPYNHTIWHLFVLGGSACHYCSIYSMLQSTIQI